MNPRKTILLSVMTLLALVLTVPPAVAHGPNQFPPPESTEWGKMVSMGNGAAQTFVTLDSSGKPEIVGIYFSAGALSGLPEAPSDGHWDVLDAAGSVVIPCCGVEYVLEFPHSINTTALKFLVVNWNLYGHPPAHVYDVPHFDFHFYSISNEERMTATAATAETMCSIPNPPDVGGEHPVLVACDTLARLTMPLPEDQLPPGYISVGEVAPGMGDHLINPQASEMAGMPFTYTWIYGASEGRLIFYEPMITLAYLEEKHEEDCTQIAMPQAQPEPGYYPSQYCIRYFSDQDAYAVTLESFVEY